MTNISNNPILILPDIPALRECFLEWSVKELEKPLSEDKIADINVLRQTFDEAFEEFLHIAHAADQSGRLHSLIFRLMICSAAYSKLAPPTENVMSSVHQAHSGFMNKVKKQQSEEADNLLVKFLQSCRSEWEALDEVPVSLANLYSERFRKENSVKLNRLRKDKGFPKKDTWPSSSTIRRVIIKLKIV